MKPIVLLLLVGLLIAGCAPADEPEETAATAPVAAATPTAPAPTAVETVTAPPAATFTATAAPEPTADESTPAVQPEATTEEQDAASLPGETSVAYGRTDEGAFFHGSPDAPVTIIDYSDFL